MATLLSKVIKHFSRHVTAVFIVNYNMPERADKLADYLSRNVKSHYDLYLIDNGSDLKLPAKNTTVFLKKNVQTCRGWIAGLEAAKKKRKYFAYLFLITSAEFTKRSGDPLSSMVNILKKDKQAVGVHPALTRDSTTAWKHLITRGSKLPRKTWMIDNIAALYRADWFDSIGWFDKRFIYAWGIDIETSYLARKMSRTIWVDESVKIKKITNIAYAMNRMNMTADDRALKASKNMYRVLNRKYGKNSWNMMVNDYVDGSMR